MDVPTELQHSLGLVNHIHRATSWTEKVPFKVVGLAWFFRLGLGGFFDQGYRTLTTRATFDGFGIGISCWRFGLLFSDTF